MRFKLKSSHDDPFTVCLNRNAFAGSRQFAALGINFSNRRRNKLAGIISSTSYDGEGITNVTVSINECLGNCPKYITVRNFRKFTRNPVTTLNYFDETAPLLNDLCKSIIAQASTSFIATRHVTSENDTSARDMGLNHRGGNPGFIRTYNENGKSYLVIPDYSGNRFYQSLGNIEVEGIAGLLIPDFTTGDALYISGEARNLYNEEAAKLMPRTSLVTRIRVDALVLIQSAIDLELVGREEMSPYNPPIKLLACELGNASKNINTNIARLVEVESISSQISTFKFVLEAPVRYPPGMHAIFDFSAHTDRKYSHMCDGKPQSINDDFVRTWTVSSSPTVSNGVFDSSSTISCTIKRVVGGVVSTYLHSKPIGVEVPLLGLDGKFSCFDSSGTAVVTDHKMVWMAGGVGITPFMSMLEGVPVSYTHLTLPTIYSV